MTNKKNPTYTNTKTLGTFTSSRKKQKKNVLFFTMTDEAQPMTDVDTAVDKQVTKQGDCCEDKPKKKKRTKNLALAKAMAKRRKAKKLAKKCHDDELTSFSESNSQLSISVSTNMSDDLNLNTGKHARTAAALIPAFAILTFPGLYINLGTFGQSQPVFNPFTGGDLVVTRGNRWFAYIMHVIVFFFAAWLTVFTLDKVSDVLEDACDDSESEEEC